MSKPLKAFREALFKEGFYKKIFTTQNPGKRIAPPKSGDNDAKYQLRIDAGEVVDGKKKIYLQVNSQAKNDVLKSFRKKNGTHANLATSTVDMNTPEKDRKRVGEEVWDDLADQAESVLG